ncbi:glycoside hydrolase family 13 protein [Tetragenococcus halophilus]|uniref:Maltogenic alpha-amylase n=1 Tax=Tetragenococcus halophilus subsp. halophilus TaxID=1513897 RepID=A0A2H6CQT5_TETHA|nr:glycoside hydrolase family 13 protein [Tetragenococcus halophilus]AOF48186.1 neopullulanase [Tetragenococcus halophilus]MCO8285072.1 alpha-glycosidase [Tetragenococcus halophilus]MCO8288905.1 alpha-glycosidase [Tetragenococcus halophilus]NWN99948.1 alpha-glycosidase [Tetragenococcus halophilus]GBD65717.1 maltogenic alpha-amylase [Tetragenococcus halophilus subsp. halophilus]
MNTAAIYHRPESEFAYLYEKETLHLRLRTAKSDISSVQVVGGDPYLVEKGQRETPIDMVKILSTDLHDYWFASVKAPFKRLSYGFVLTSEDHVQVFYGDQGLFPLSKNVLGSPNLYFRLPYFHEIDRFKALKWAEETVWYQIFPERFANGDKSNDPKGALRWGSKVPGRQDYFGGDLQGVIDHLDYVKELGINGIYLCPIFKAYSNHKYDTIDYRKIDPDFGDEKVFKNLVEECHKRGIKVMLDAVFNHMGDQSPQWQDVLAKGKDSKYAEWFHVNAFPASYKESNDFEEAHQLTYDTFAFTPHMPKLNTANPEVQEYLLDTAKYWIENFDIDAWRLDVANEVDHAFWKKFRKVCDETKKDFYILGEIWHSAQKWLEGDESHAVMNYAYTDAIMGYFVKKQLSLKEMVSAINQQLMLYRDQTNQVQFNVLDSHDTPRLLTQAQEDKELMKQVLVFTYLQPGVPCLYYGDEIGMTGGADPLCRKCMVWKEDEQDQELFQFVKKLIALRKTWQKMISQARMDWQETNEENGLLILERKLNGETLQAIFNTGKQEMNLAITGEILFSHLSQQKVERITLQAKGFLVLKI